MTTFRTSTRTWTSTSRSWRASVSDARAFRSARAGAARAGSWRGTWRILGIDPGTLRMGYGLVECRGAAGGRSEVAYVECGVLTASARHARPARLREIGCGLRELLQE